MGQILFPSMHNVIWPQHTCTCIPKWISLTYIYTHLKKDYSTKWLPVLVLYMYGSIIIIYNVGYWTWILQFFDCQRIHVPSVYMLHSACISSQRWQKHDFKWRQSSNAYSCNDHLPNPWKNYCHQGTPSDNCSHLKANKMTIS